MKHLSEIVFLLIQYAQIKSLIAHLVYYSGLPVLIREAWQRKKVTILTFHNPRLEQARILFNWLRKNYNIIDLNLFIKACREKDPSILPPKALIISMDDGHANNYDLLPYLKKEKIPATIFLCSGIVNTNRQFWFRYQGVVGHSDKYKNLPNSVRLQSLAEIGYYPEKEFDLPQALSKTQIMELKPYINFQSHTVSHPCLDTCSDEESWREIRESKECLEKEYGLEINAIAYPNGDYTGREERFAKKAGYSCALTMDRGFNKVTSNPFRLKRLSVSDEDSVKILALKACGLWLLRKRKTTGQAVN